MSASPIPKTAPFDDDDWPLKALQANSDTLILMGDADDWTPATRCTTYVTAQRDQPHALEIKVYPGAYHAFDAPGAPRAFFGHMLGYHAFAAEDSYDMTRAFLDARLK